MALFPPPDLPDDGALLALPLVPLKDGDVVTQAGIEELKKELGIGAGNDVPLRYHAEVRLRRFLRARNGDVSGAAAQIRADVEWRAKERINDLCEKFPIECPQFKVMQDYWPSGYYGEDMNGCPVYWERLGLVDPASCMAKVQLSDLLRFHIYIMEVAERLRDSKLLQIHAQDPTKPVEDRGMLYIMDLSDFSFSRHFYLPAVNLATGVVTIDEDHYPEVLRALLIVNAPSIFGTFWSALSPFVHARTLGKISIVSGGPDDYLPILAQAIGKPDCIPVFVDGRHHTPHPVQASGFIKELGPGGRFGGVASDGSTVTPVSVKVSANSEYRHVLSVPASASADGAKWQLRWDFTTKDHDIGFSVWRIPHAFTAAHGARALEDIGRALPRESVEVIKRDRVQSQQKPATGHLAVNPVEIVSAADANDVECIVFVLVWDNGYSFLRGKDLTYEARVDPLVEVETPGTAGISVVADALGLVQPA